jgi:hypothetical protein
MAMSTDKKLNTLANRLSKYQSLSTSRKRAIFQSIVHLDFSQRSYSKMLLQGGGRLIEC